MRKIRTHLLKTHEGTASPVGPQANLSLPAELNPSLPAPESVAPSAFPASVGAHSPSHKSARFTNRHQAAEELSSRSGRKTRRLVPVALTSSKPEPGQTARRSPVVSSLSAAHPSAPKNSHRLTIERAVQEYLQAHREVGHRLKTLEWHQTVLGHFQQYVLTECYLLLVNQITETTICNWLAFLARAPTARGLQRAASTVETYARSARAFFGWLVERRMLSCSPLSERAFPRTRVPLPHVVSPATFDQAMRAGFPRKVKAPGAMRMAARDPVFSMSSTRLFPSGEEVVQETRKRRRLVKRSTTPTFLLELPLRVDAGQARRLRAHFEAGRCLYNALLGEAMKRLRAMRADPAWQEARALPQARKQERKEAFSRLRQIHGFSEYALHEFAKEANCAWIADHIDSMMAQTLATRAYQAANRVCLGQAKNVRFRSKGRGLDSVENKRNDTGMRFVLDPNAGDGGFLIWNQEVLLAASNGAMPWSGMACAIPSSTPGLCCARPPARRLRAQTQRATASMCS
jgi:hypothetical protein